MSGEWQARFWSYVDKSGGPDACWPWLKSKYGDGYGRFKHAGEDASSHRVAWELVHGPIPRGHDVLHHCDNPPCCNAFSDRHLFTGTQADNMRDMIEKGRGRGNRFDGSLRGELNGRAKLTDELVRRIRRDPESTCGMARRLGVSETLVRMVRQRSIWRHVA